MAHRRSVDPLTDLIYKRVRRDVERKQAVSLYTEGAKEPDPTFTLQYDVAKKAALDLDRSINHYSQQRRVGHMVDHLREKTKQSAMTRGFLENTRRYGTDSFSTYIARMSQEIDTRIEKLEDAIDVSPEVDTVSVFNVGEAKECVLETIQSWRN